MALRRAGGLASVGGEAFQEAGQIAEAKLAAEVIVLCDVDRGTAELVTKFQIVAADLPRVVVDEVPIRIDTLTWDARARANHGEVTYRDLGQTEIKRGHAGVESNRARVEAAVFRKESLGKTVPSQTRFVH